jgi:hypothetical protein
VNPHRGATSKPSARDARKVVARGAVRPGAGHCLVDRGDCGGRGRGISGCDHHGHKEWRHAQVGNRGGQPQQSAGNGRSGIEQPAALGRARRRHRSHPGRGFADVKQRGCRGAHPRPSRRSCRRPRRAGSSQHRHRPNPGQHQSATHPRRQRRHPHRVPGAAPVQSGRVLLRGAGEPVRRQHRRAARRQRQDIARVRQRERSNREPRRDRLWATR